MTLSSDFRGASKESLESLLAELDSVLAGSLLGRLVDTVRGTARSGADPDRVSADLFGVSALLGREPGLRRTLTDASLPAKAKGELVRQVFGGRLDAASVDLVEVAAAGRWTRVHDLSAALEWVAVVAIVRAAGDAGDADRLEDDLFRILQLVGEHHDLRDALSDPGRSPEDRRVLLQGLLEGKVSPAALALAGQAVGGRHRTVVAAVEEYQRIAADQRQRTLALVRVARPLGDAERDRLAEALSSQYGRPVHLNVVVDPSLVGGLVVEIGDDVIDGTVAGRIDDARRRLAG
ncbi:MAG: F-type H+-transporting ATPase subunit delta [Nocardioidaceae bacterium]|jgi:F-type H+-transporting ATPase subunit delta|nr:F-type H+-transporting ATPase subunit delta [Nocardioidaceae bacterium]